jgi:hypothetical protein
MLEYLAIAGGLLDRAGSSFGSSLAVLDDFADWVESLLADPPQLAVVILIGMAGAFAIVWLVRRL